MMDEKLEEIKEQYNIDMTDVAESMLNSDKSECNQCHSNCNDCGYDR